MEKKPNPIDAKIGENIKAYRVKLGLTQAQLGARMNPPFSHQTVQKYESGEIRVTATGLVDIAGIVGVHVGQLFDGVQGILQAHADPISAEARMKDEALLDSIRAITDEEVREAIRNMTMAVIRGVASAMKPAY